MTRLGRLVSILTPTYNHAAYVRECIDSVLAQSYSNWELIVVDDGSTDGTADVARAVKDPRVRVHTREHAGIDHLAATFNFALDQARGELIGILEGDDRWPANRLDRQVPLLDDAAVVLSYGRYAVIGADGLRISAPPLAGPGVDTAYDAFPALLLDSFIMPVTTLIRREALLRIGGFQQIEGHGHVDYATWLRLSRTGLFQGTHDVVAEWRRHPNSATAQSNFSDAHFAGAYLCRDLALQTLKELGEWHDPPLPTPGQIEMSWNSVLSRRLWQSGRVMQHHGHWSRAAQLFRRGLRLRGAGATSRLKLAFGLASTWARIDIDAWLRLGRTLRRNYPWQRFAR